MGNNSLLQKEGGLHKREAKVISYLINAANYIEGYTLLVSFHNGEKKQVDFEPAINKYAKGYYSRYALLSNFKKFKIAAGNIVWGKDWDLIFKQESIYNGSF